MLGLCVTPCLGKTLKQGNDLVIGKSYTLFSKILGEERSIWVYLPPGYEKSRESYPVFYLLDGEIHFHAASGAVDILSRYSHMPRMIVVAVTTVDRERDFLSTRVKGWPPKAAADRFRAFFKQELIPLVEKTYRVRPYRILCGHSFGGVFCIDALLKDPDLFTAYISISPDLSWDDRLLLKKAEKVFKTASFNKKFLFFVTSGDDEGAIPPTKEFAALLRTLSPKGLEWRFENREKDDHLTVVHPTIYNALLWLHKGWRLWETTLENMTLEQVKDHYKKLSQRYGAEVAIPEGVLLNLGYSLQDHGNTPGSIEAFTHLIELYPGEATGYLGLGDIYMEAGKLNLAKQNLQSAVKIAEKNNDKMLLPIARALLERVVKKIKH
jgi:predicted alpha/beta superfamily hydrolase